jgi:hypothetical protein
MTMNRREGALSMLAGQPRPLPLRKSARSPFVPVLIQPLDLTNLRGLETYSRLYLAIGNNSPADANAFGRDIGRNDEVTAHATAFCFSAWGMRAAQMSPASSRATAPLAFVIGELNPSRSDSAGRDPAWPGREGAEPTAVA